MLYPVEDQELSLASVSVHSNGVDLVWGDGDFHVALNGWN